MTFKVTTLIHISFPSNWKADEIKRFAQDVASGDPNLTNNWDMNMVQYSKKIYPVEQL